MIAPSLSVRDLEVFYGEAQVLYRVSLEVSGGEIVAVVGPNGSGKSTLCSRSCRERATGAGADHRPRAWQPVASFAASEAGAAEYSVAEPKAFDGSAVRQFDGGHSAMREAQFPVVGCLSACGHAQAGRF